MPLQQTSGTASYDAFGGGVAAVPKYIEDYFSTFLFKGNASTQTITNGIDLSVKGGLVWTKSRTNANEALIYDTVRGVNNYIIPSSTQEAQTSSGTLTAFNSNGFTLGANDNSNDSSTENSVSWSIAKAPKFFDVVTYTGDGNNARTIAHNLGSTPGFVIIKKTDSTGNWMCWHNSFASTDYIALNTTGAKNYAGSLTDIFQGVSSTTVTVGSNGVVNSSVNSYVMYVFASNAGGFGLTGTDNVISCGSFTTDGSGYATVNLGYEPQWILWKRSDGATNWFIADSMRGLTTSDTTSVLSANLSNAEDTGYSMQPLSTGFKTGGAASATYIYIAIRRGPMKVPTSGTSVFAPVTYTGNGSSQSLTAGFPIDLSLFKYRGGATNSFEWFDRLRGTSPELRSAYTYAELATTTEVTSFASNTQVTVGASSDTGGTNVSGQTYVLEAFRRAPSFFDEVCYTGTGSATTFNHNLGVAPELMIAKERSSTGSWWVYAAPIWGTNTGDPNYDILALEQTTQRDYNNAIFNSTQPTASVFSVGGSGFDINDSGATYVNYLFASCPAVSKVGSYTGTGTTLQVNCGFTGGARFVLIKRTDSTGAWYVWDSARGIVAGNDPYLLLNSTAAETTTTDYIDTYSAGFEISSTAPAAINASGGTYLFLAIA